MMEPAEAGVRSRRGKPTARRQIGCDSLVSDTPRTIQRKKEFSWGHSFPFKDNFLLTQIKNTKIIYQNLLKNLCGLQRPKGPTRFAPVLRRSGGPFGEPRSVVHPVNSLLPLEHWRRGK
jgi:hypothetical protein